MKTHTLIEPITIKKVTPATERLPEKVTEREVSEIKLKGIGGRDYFLTGNVAIFAQSDGGGLIEVELDDALQVYVAAMIDDPDAQLILAGLKLADTLYLRDEVFTLFAEAEEAAAKAAAGAPAGTVRLIRPFDYHGEVAKELTLVPPTFRDVMRFGKPYAWTRLRDSGQHVVDKFDVLRSYVEVCLKHEAGNMALGYLSLADAIQVKRTIIGFFSQATARSRLARSSTSSSSDPASSPPATDAA